MRRALALHAGSILAREVEALQARVDELRPMAALGVRAQYTERELQQLYKALEPLCPCDPNPATTDGPQQECPLHGDGVTFVAEVLELRAELEQRRASVTTGGPPPGITPGWTRGPSSRPSTAPPEPEEVELP